jgi:hypothetical protein
MATTPQDQNMSEQISAQTQLPEASRTADDFYRDYLNEERDIYVGPCAYPVTRNHDALPWDFPARKFVDVLSTDAKNTLHYLLHVSRAAKENRRAHYLPQRANKTTDQRVPNARPQLATKLAAMKSLSERAARAMRELDEKLVQ